MKKKGKKFDLPNTQQSSTKWKLLHFFYTFDFNNKVEWMNEWIDEWPTTKKFFFFDPKVKYTNEMIQSIRFFFLIWSTTPPNQYTQSTPPSHHHRHHYHIEYVICFFKNPIVMKKRKNDFWCFNPIELRILTSRGFCFCFTTLFYRFISQKEKKSSLNC